MGFDGSEAGRDGRYAIPNRPWRGQRAYLVPGTFFLPPESRGWPDGGAGSAAAAGPAFERDREVGSGGAREEGGGKAHHVNPVSGQPRCVLEEEYSCFGTRIVN